MTRRHALPCVRALSAALCLGIVFAGTAAATPHVTAGGQPYGGSWITDEAESPEALTAQINGGSGANTAWAQAVPGELRLSATCGATPDSWYNSQAYATFVDHFHAARPGLPSNVRGTFQYNLVLTGTMRVNASSPMDSWSQVSVSASYWYGNPVGGMLSFGQVGGAGTLYALGGEVGGGGYPMNNIFAGKDGAMKIYGTVSTPTGGYYTIHVRMPVKLVIPNFLYNQSPPADDWDSRLEISLMAAAFEYATADFSSTFEFAEQNPIVPEPDASGLPADNWSFTCASAQITLPSPPQVATATATGNAVFAVDLGNIGGLAAVAEGSLPAGRPTGLTHGAFSLQVADLAASGTAVLTLSLPSALAAGAHWWYHDAAKGWRWLALDDDDGDNVYRLTVHDGGPGDATGVDGTISLLGGPTAAPIPDPVRLALFDAAPRDGGVDVVWRFADAATAADFTLTARLGTQSWAVPCVANGEGSFRARDEHGALLGGGRVTYELAWQGESLASIEVALDAPPAPLALKGIFPNPFNPSARIAFVVHVAQRVCLTVHDLAGRRVAELGDADYAPGAYSLEWNGLDEEGRAMPSGSYVVRLAGEQRAESRLISLVR